MKFYLTHIYPKKMCIYGDLGNVLILKNRLKQYGFEVLLQHVDVGDDMPEKTDMYFIGGGQDNDQFLVYKDFLNKKEKLVEDVEGDVPILAICGGYQFLGKKFFTGDGQIIDGIGLFPVETKAPSTDVKTRCIGNVVIKSNLKNLDKDTLFVGFENHSGQTRFIDRSKVKPLGQVLVGFGNNLEDKEEGCIYKNAIGTYMHGPCLSKNPELADWLIIRALEKKALLGDIKKDDLIRITKIDIDDSIPQLAKQKMIEQLNIKLDKI